MDTFDTKIWFVKWQLDILMLKEQYRQMKIREMK